MTTTDIAETLRMNRLTVLNVDPGDRKTLEERHGQVWNPVELHRDFIAVGYLAPLVVVQRRSDHLVGTLEFQHDPRFYFNWREDR